MKDDFLDLLVAGRPQVVEAANEAEAASSQAASGLLSAFETLNDEDPPSSGCSSWHWFENAFREFLTKQSRVLSAGNEILQLEMDSEDSESSDMSRPSYRNQ